MAERPDLVFAALRRLLLGALQHIVGKAVYRQRASVTCRCLFVRQKGAEMGQYRSEGIKYCSTVHEPKRSAGFAPARRPHRQTGGMARLLL